MSAIVEGVVLGVELVGELAAALIKAAGSHDAAIKAINDARKDAIDRVETANEAEHFKTTTRVE